MNLFGRKKSAKHNKFFSYSSQGRRDGSLKFTKEVINQVQTKPLKINKIA